MEATVKVAFVNPPRGGAKSASIRTSEGDYYGIPVSMMSEFSPKNTYKVEYTTTQASNGKTYRNITSAQPVVAPAESFGGSNDPALAERIFVCGGLNSQLGNPNIHPKDITAAELVDMVNELREAWKRTFGGEPTHGDEMNDEIPY